MEDRIFDRICLSSRDSAFFPKLTQLSGGPSTHSPSLLLFAATFLWYGGYPQRLTEVGYLLDNRHQSLMSQLRLLFGMVEVHFTKRILETIL